MLEHLWLSANVTVAKKLKYSQNPKTVLHIMTKYDLLSEIRRHRKWIQMGQQAYRYKNLLNQQFQTDKVNAKWVTDISYIHTRQAEHVAGQIRQTLPVSMLKWQSPPLFCAPTAVPPSGNAYKTSKAMGKAADVTALRSRIDWSGGEPPEGGNRIGCYELKQSHQCGADRL